MALYLEEGAIGNNNEPWEEVRIQDTGLRHNYTFFVNHADCFECVVVNRPERNSVLKDIKTLDVCMLAIDENGILFMDDRGGANVHEFVIDSNRKISKLFEDYMMGRL